jgi:hypothetical protein
VRLHPTLLQSFELSSIPLADMSIAWDYIICGYAMFRIQMFASMPFFADNLTSGGTAGCAIAARLAQKTGSSILLIEAGPSKDAVPASAIPAA